MSKHVRAIVDRSPYSPKESIAGEPGVKGSLLGELGS